MKLFSLMALVLLIILSPSRTVADEQVPLPLPDKHCEASGARIVPCLGSERCVLVADNEEEKSVFLLRVDAQGSLGNAKKVSLRDAGGKVENFGDV